MPGNRAALSLVPDEEDQVPRLERFRAAHPEVVILLRGALPKAWVGSGFGRAPDGCGDHDWLALGNGLQGLPGPYGLTSRSSWPLRRAGTLAEGHWLHAKVHPGHFAR